MGNAKGVGEREREREIYGGFDTIWLPCTSSSSLVYSPVCATCRSIVNSHFLVCFCCLLPCASVVDLAFDVMLMYAKRVPSAGSCFGGSARPYMYTMCMFIFPPCQLLSDPITESGRVTSGWPCLAFLSLELLLRKYLCLHFEYFRDTTLNQRIDNQSTYVPIKVNVAFYL